jgi:hypothetical protein
MLHVRDGLLCKPETHVFCECLTILKKLHDLILSGNGKIKVHKSVPKLILLLLLVLGKGSMG